MLFEDGRDVNIFICLGDRISKEGMFENIEERRNDLYRVIFE